MKDEFLSNSFSTMKIKLRAKILTSLYNQTRLLSISSQRIGIVSIDMPLWKYFEYSPLWEYDHLIMR